MRFAHLLICLGFVFELLACGDNSTTTTAIDRPELVAVQPSDFLGLVPCGSSGTLSYVATLFDVTPDAQGNVPNPGFQLPSSPATTCRAPVTFSFVRQDHRYLAEVDAYDLAPTSLTSLGSGTRTQLDAASNRVAPRWTAICGDYPPSPNPDGGVYPGLAGTAGGSGDRPPGVRSYDETTQTPHNCGVGLVATSDAR